MVDLKKRKTLALIGAGSAAAAIPSLASAALPTHLGDHHCASDASCTEIRMELTAAQQPTVRISNDSAHTAVVRHVYPGVIHAGARTYDVNSLFANGPVIIEAGHSVTLPLQPARSATITETVFPRHQYANLPQRIARLRGVDEKGAIINSTRSFYS